MKVLGKFITIIFKGAIGLAAIYFTNMLLNNWQISIGLNACNGLIIGILGLSGYLLLYVLAVIDILLIK